MKLKVLARPNLIGAFVSLAILLAISVVLNSPNASQSALLRGDFPAFFSLAQIASSENSSQLYDLALQTKIQNQFWPQLNGGVLIAVYPPAVAFILSPLTSLPIEYAHLLFSAFSLLALCLSVFLLAKSEKDPEKRQFLLLGLALSNPFILIGSLGGQNTAFSIFIAFCGYLLLRKSDGADLSRYEYYAGLILSLWLFKPQYGLCILPFLFIFKFHKACLGYLLGSTGHYFAGVYLLGWSWPMIWLQRISEFAQINYTSNQNIHTSFLSLISLINKSLLLSEDKLVAFITWCAFPAFVLALCLALRKLFSRPPTDALIIFISCFPFLNPQAQYYDIGIPAFFFIFFAARQKIFPGKLCLTLWAISWIFILFKEDAGHFLFPALSLTFILAIWRIHKNQPASLAHERSGLSSIK